MLTKRTNILFENELWDLLVGVAQREKTSVGEIVRKAVRKVYSEDEIIERRKKALETIKRIRVRQKGIVDYKALINEGRKY